MAEISVFLEELNSYSPAHKGKLVPKLRTLTNTLHPEDYLLFLKSKHISKEDIFDRIFFNKICRDFNTIKYIAANKVPLTQSQLTWISQTKHIKANTGDIGKVFIKKYGLNVRSGRMSINELAKYTYEHKLRISDGTLNRTIKMGVRSSEMDTGSKDWLDKYLVEWHDLTYRVLEDIYKMFKGNESAILQRAAKLSYTENYRDKKFDFRKELFTNSAVKGFKIGDKKYKIYKYSYKVKSDDKTDKVEFVAEDQNNTRIALSPIKSDNGEEVIDFRVEKFDATALGNFIDKKYITQKINQDPLFNGFKVADEARYINFARMREPFRQKIAETVCSFLEKYYMSLSEIDVIYRQNQRLFQKNTSVEELGELLQIFTYPRPLTQKKRSEVDSYNAFVTSYNQFINEQVWQSDAYEKATKEKVEKLRIIKGVPSFPLVEKIESRDYDLILRDIQTKYRELKKKIEDLNWTKVDRGRLSIWLGRKSAKPGITLNKYFERLASKYEQDNFKRLIIPEGEALNIWKEAIAFLETKIATTKIDLSTPKKARDVADIYAQYVAFASEVLFDKKSEDYNRFRIEFNTWTALLKASPFEELKQEKQEISFLGFSLLKIQQQAFALCFREINGKLQFFLVFNLKENINIELVDDSEYKMITYIGSGENLEPVLSPMKFEQKEGTCILPLAFGKRIGRRYFYNDSVRSKFNELEFLSSLQVKFSNVRVISEDKKNGKGKNYFCSISLERRALSSARTKKYSFENIVGVDMGEKIPAVLAQLDQKNRINDVRFLRKELNQKLLEIQNKKDKAQQSKAQIPLKLNNKIKNVTKTLLEDIAIESLEYAITRNALLVSEDLSRGFGRGKTKGTYVWMSQYTKLNDVLVLKAQEIGMTDLKGAKDYKALYTPRGILAKVPAGYTSKTSIQSGFILRSPSHLSLIDPKANISDVEEIHFMDDLGTTFKLDIRKRAVTVQWKSYENTVFYKNPSDLGEFYGSDFGASNREEMLKQVFEKKDKDTTVRRNYLIKFVYNLLNPRKRQAEYKDIFTGMMVNADVQGAVNVARSFLFAQSKHYHKGMKTIDRLKAWQNWYLENLTDIPKELFIKDGLKA